jgi:hypothetical protein
VTDTATEQKLTTKKKRPARKLNGYRQPILATAIYSRPEAAQVAGCAIITLIRAYTAGHLMGYRQGRLVKHSGQHLLDWLEAGGKTGWGRRGPKNG